MRINKFRRSHGRSHQSGQVMLFVLLGLGIFLLGAMAFAIDLSNLWFNRQTAQTAADAACTAGAMDLLVDATDGGTHGSFTPGTAFDCNTNTGYAPCKYASLNGFESSIAQGSTSLGNNVYVDFPARGTPPPGVTAPPAALAATPFLRVTITNNIPTFFAGMLKGLSTQSVKAYAVCGLQVATAPIPIIVLHPDNAASLGIKGGGGVANVAIVGGPKQSIEVNSCSSSGNSSAPCGTSDAASLGGNAKIDLCQAGPSFCGGNMGVFGAEAEPGGFNTTCGTNALCTGGGGTQSTPQWNSPQAPISDPFAQTAAPSQPSAATTPYFPSDLCGPKDTGCTVNSADSTGKADCSSTIIAAGNCFVDYKVHECPDSTAPALGTAPSNKGGCQLYTPGYYPSGITVKNGVAVFDPGLYWVDTDAKGNGGLTLQANSFVRPSFYTGGYTSSVPSWFSYKDALGNVDGGTIFYFHGLGTVSVSANSGTTNGGTAPDSFGGNAYQGAGGDADHLVQCPNGGTFPNPNLPASIGGNILIAPCSLSGTWGDTSSSSGGATTYASDRGILFFQDRGNSGSGKTSVQANWGGGGQFLLAGTMYFHQCVIGQADTGTGCDTTTPAFNDVFTLGGNSGSTTYVLGEIITDQLAFNGGSSVAMHLSPTAKYNILKVALLQ